MYTYYDRNSARRRSQRLRKPEALLASKQPLDHKYLAPRSLRLETHDHSTFNLRRLHGVVRGAARAGRRE